MCVIAIRHVHCTCFETESEKLNSVLSSATAELLVTWRESVSWKWLFLILHRRKPLKIVSYTFHSKECQHGTGEASSHWCWVSSSYLGQQQPSGDSLDSGHQHSPPPPPLPSSLLLKPRSHTGSLVWPSSGKEEKVQRRNRAGWSKTRPDCEKRRNWLFHPIHHRKIDIAGLHIHLKLRYKSDTGMLPSANAVNNCKKQEQVVMPAELETWV